MVALVSSVLLGSVRPTSVAAQGIVQVQEKGGTEIAQSTSLVTPISTTAGDLIVVTASLRGVHTFAATPVTDTGGNTYSTLETEVTGNNVTGMFYAADAAAVTTVTVSASATATIVASVQEFSGVSQTAPLDVKVGATGTSTAPSSGASPTTSQAVELVVAGIGWNQSTSISGQSSGYTVNTSHQSTPSSAVNNVQSAYLVTSATGAQTYAATLGASTFWGDALATFVVATAPSAPQNVGATAGNAQAGVSWQAPASNGGSPITSYTVTPYVGSTAQTSLAVTVGGSTLSTTVTGLTNGTAYTFQVTATNATGTGPPGTSPAVTPTAPSGPVQVQEKGGTEIAQSTSLATPISTTAGDLIVVTASLRGVHTFAATPVTDTGGNTYSTLETEVTGNNVTGMFYAADAAAVTTVTVSASATATIVASVQEFSGVSQTAPLDVKVGATGTSTAPSSGASPTTSQAVELVVAGIGWNQSTSISGQSSGYTVNTSHQSTPSSAVNNVQSAYLVTSATGAQTYAATLGASTFWGDTVATFLVTSAPSAPTDVVAQAVSSTDSDGRATVAWVAPPSPGSAISKYTITPYVGSTAQTSLAQTDTDTNGAGTVIPSYGIPGLTKGTAYTFGVTATNATGTGPSGFSNLVVPAAPPAYTIPGTGGTTSSAVIVAPATGYDNGKVAQDGTTPEQVVVGNVATGGTGWPDIVTANGGGANGGDSLSTLKNLKSTNGFFAQPASTSAPGEAAGQVALGNLFGHSDGAEDAVVVDNTATIYVLENNDNGTGTFTQQYTYALPSGYDADYVELGNVHSTSGTTLDIVVTGAETDGCYGNSQSFAAVLLGNGNGTFSSPTDYDAGDCANGVNNSCSSAWGLALADLNGDGLVDIVYPTDAGHCNGNDGGRINELLNLGSGNFGPPTKVATGAGMSSVDGHTIVVGDFTGNGIADLAVTTNSHFDGTDNERGLIVFLGNGSGGFPASVFYRDPALEDSSQNDYGDPAGIALADMNGDEVPDIVTADDGSISGVGGFSVYLNTGTTSGPDLPQFIPTPGFKPEGIALANVSGHPDGEADVVLENNASTSGSQPSNVEVLINGTDFPPLGGALGPNEMHGCLMCQALAAGGSLAVDGDPVTVNSGEFSETLTDISIPARGLPIQVTQTYNSLNAGTNSGLGYGWWSPLFMSVSSSPSTGITSVTEEDGAEAQFWTSTLEPVAPRTQATLAHNGDGTWTFTRYAGETFTFNSSGQITKIADLTGDSLSFGYTGGKVSSLTDSDGRSLSIAWSGGDISSITDGNVSGQTRTVAFTYGTGSHANELTQIDWRASPGSTDLTEEFSYDKSTWVHGLVSLTDPDGHVVTQTYNSDGTTASQTVDPSGLDRTTTYSYYPARTSTYSAIAAVVVTDPASHQEVDEFAYGELVQKTTGLTGCSTTLSGTWPTGCTTTAAATTTYAFDPTSLGTTLTVDPNGNVSTATYDSLGNVLSQTDGLGRTTSWTYTGNGGADETHYQPTTMTDPKGTTTYYSYDPTYRTLTQVCTALSGGSCSGTPTNAEVTKYAHANGSHPGDVTSMTNGDGKVTSYTYDAYGDLVQTEDPASDVTETEYNADGWTTASWTPAAGCTFGSQPPAGCSSADETAYSQTSGAGNINFWGATLSVAAPLGQDTSSVYDPDNNLIETTDADGNPTSYAYNGAGEQCWKLPGGTSSASCAAPPSGASVTQYSPDGLVAAQIDGNDDTLEAYVYDSRNDVSSMTVDPGSSPHINQTTTYTYDLDGNVLTKTDPAGNVTTYAYDADSELCWYLLGSTSSASCGSAPSGAVSYGYDPDGQVTAMADDTGSWSYTIDALHRLTSVTEAQGGGSSATVSYQYNFRNEPTQITYPNGVGSVTIGYDNAGRETSVEDWNGHTTTFGYDADSNLTTTTFPGGSCTGTISLCDTWTYDSLDQVMGISDVQSGGTTVFSATYTRDEAGQVTSDGSAAASQTCFTYTTQNQVAAAEAGTTGTGSTQPPCASGSTPEPFAYDPGQNLTTLGGTQQRFSTADQLCWTIAGTSSDGCGTVPSGATAYYYNGSGNNGGANRTATVPASGAATCDSYNAANLLTEIQTGTWNGSGCSSPSTVATYLYNGAGLRMSKTVGGTTSLAAWDLSGSLPLQIEDGSTYYIYGPGGLPLEQISGSTTLWYHHDQDGTTRAITDSSGNVKATYQTDPYGNVTACTGATVTVGGSNICTGTITVANPFIFQGQYRDNEFGPLLPPGPLLRSLHRAVPHRGP